MHASIHPQTPSYESHPHMNLSSTSHLPLPHARSFARLFACAQHIPSSGRDAKDRTEGHREWASKSSLNALALDDNTRSHACPAVHDAIQSLDMLSSSLLPPWHCACVTTPPPTATMAIYSTPFTCLRPATSRHTDSRTDRPTEHVNCIDGAVARLLTLDSGCVHSSQATGVAVERNESCVQ